LCNYRQAAKLVRTEGMTAGGSLSGVSCFVGCKTDNLTPRDAALLWLFWPAFLPPKKVVGLAVRELPCR
ncbi:MAG: hypothetical protein WAW63_03080, partial [Candidatus Saccharimonadales bacterium]